MPERQAQAVYDRLRAHYGPRRWEARREPLDELVFTVLSQHTSDTNTFRTYATLVKRFPTWEAIESAPTQEVEQAIRSGGLAHQKAPRIQAVLRTVRERTGGFDLSFLAEMPLAEAKAWLKALPGVGPKTAAVVLCFALGLPAMPVDTHVHRVAKRLGLIGPRVTADQAHDVLERSVAADQVFAFHVYLITHGRRVCKATRPLCDRCVLAQGCPSRGIFAT